MNADRCCSHDVNADRCSHVNALVPNAFVCVCVVCVCVCVNALLGNALLASNPSEASNLI